MRVLLFVVLACMVVPLAHAVDAVVTCSAPLTFDDAEKTPIPLSAAIYTLYGGKQGSPKVELAESATCRFVRPNLATGVHEYYLTLSAPYKGSPPIESGPSQTVSYTVGAVPPPDRDGDGMPDASDACPDVKGTSTNGCPAIPPPPPINVTVETMTAYEYRPSTNSMVDIGLVPEATACGPETMSLKSVVYCRVKLADSLPIVRPANKKIREVWVVKPPA